LQRVATSPARWNDSKVYESVIDSTPAVEGSPARAGSTKNNTAMSTLWLAASRRGRHWLWPSASFRHIRLRRKTYGRVSRRLPRETLKTSGAHPAVLHRPTLPRYRPYMLWRSIAPIFPIDITTSILLAFSNSRLSTKDTMDWPSLGTRAALRKPWQGCQRGHLGLVGHAFTARSAMPSWLVAIGQSISWTRVPFANQWRGERGNNL
jgi:hypothetical protein